MRNKYTVLITKVAIFSALSAILYVVPWLQFSLPIFPQFLKFQFSNFPAILCGFLGGPVAGVCVIVIKILIKILCVGSDTFIIGELADLIIGLVVVLTSSLIYKKYHSKKGGIIALLMCTLAWALAGVIANWLVLAPAYIGMMGENGKQVFIGMLSIYPWVNENNYMLTYLFVGVLPFNLLLATVSNLVTFIVYKKTSILFHKIEKN